MLAHGCSRQEATEGSSEFWNEDPGTDGVARLVARAWMHAYRMEATGIYSKPIYDMFEDEFELVVGNAHDIKNVPGRKTDVKDSEWIADLLRRGLIAKSFVPSKPIREYATCCAIAASSWRTARLNATDCSRGWSSSMGHTASLDARIDARIDAKLTSTPWMCVVSPPIWPVAWNVSATKSLVQRPADGAAVPATQ